MLSLHWHPDLVVRLTPVRVPASSRAWLTSLPRDQSRRLLEWPRQFITHCNAVNLTLHSQYGRSLAGSFSSLAGNAG